MVVHAVVRKGDGNGRLPGTVFHLLTDHDVTFLTLQVVECGHAEVNQYGVALDDCGEQRLARCSDQRTQVDVAFTDMSRNRGAYDGVTQLEFSLVQVGLTHTYTGYCRFVGRNGVVQVQLAGCVLFIQRADTFQVAFCLACLSLVFLQLCPYTVGLCLVLVLIDDEQHLVTFYVGTFFEKHFFQIPFHTGSDFDELLGTDTSDVLTINLYILFLDRHDTYYRCFRNCFFFSREIEVQANDDGYPDDCINSLFLFYLQVFPS